MDAARKKLHAEFDFEHIVQVLRISRFLAQLQLTRRQRLTVEFFRKYAVLPKDIKRLRDGKEKHVRGLSVDSIVKGLHPHDNAIDRRILFELAGVRLDEDEFREESSFESEDDKSGGAFDEHANDDGLDENLLS